MQRNEYGNRLIELEPVGHDDDIPLCRSIACSNERSIFNGLGADTLTGQHDDKREQRYALMLQRKEADGFIFLGHRLPKAAAQLVRESAPRCAPVVNACEFSPTLGVPSVHIDNTRAAFEVVDHLCRLGHKHIGVVTGPLVSPLSRDRLQGVMTRARADGIADLIAVVHGDFSIESGAIAA